MQFDHILVEIGAFGKFQKIVCVLLWLTAAPAAWHAIGQVFFAANTDHWCAIPDDQSLNCSYSEHTGSQSVEECLELQKYLTIPSTVDEEGNIVYSKCERYATVLDTNVTSERDASSNETVSCDAGWEYDRSQYKTTIIQDVIIK